MQRDLRALFAELVQSLHDESDALIRGDADQVAALAACKSDLLLRIAPLASRGARLPLDLVRQAKDLNDRNAVLLAPRLTATRARLDALRQAGSATLYGANGLSQAINAPLARA